MSTAIPSFSENGSGSPFLPSAQNHLLPIFKLHPDLLWRIFLMNANMNNDAAIRYRRSGGVVEDNRALTVTRESSQVCQLWRNIILESPSLWGRIIDLDLLQQKKSAWIDEVIRRSGQAMLHIKGTYILQDPMKLELITPLLGNHWERIQRLEFTIYQSNERFIDQILRVVKLPTKSLESFNMHFAVKADHDTVADPLPMPSLTTRHTFFAADAPSLREFQWTYFDFDIPIQGRWLSQLHTLFLAFIPRRKIAQFLDALAEMPLLRSLTLTMSVAPPGNVEVAQTRISLPNLVVITMKDTLQTCASFLYNIDPSRGCLLRLFSTLESSSDDVLNFASRVLDRYSRNYFDIHLPMSLSIHLFSWKLEFFDDAAAVYHPSNPSNFNLTFMSNPGEILGASSLPILLSSLATCRYINVTSLHLRFRSSILDPSDPNFQRLLLGLSSVTAIEATEEDLYFLHRSGHSATTQIVFPNLRTLIDIRVTGKWARSQLHPDDSNSPPILLCFLISRREAGVPIETLDFTRCFKYPGDMQFLEEISGLKVIWNAVEDDPMSSNREYICGSGHPETLLLRST